jgi:uncharacterized protein YggE
MFRTLLAASALVLATAFVSPVSAEDLKMPRTISLTGHGEVHAAPDLAVVSLGVSSFAATAAEALAANSTAMTDVFARLKEAGIADKDMQTSNFQVNPRYNYPPDGKAPELVGYDVTNMVTVKLRKLESLGGLLDKVVSAGSNTINGISFQIDNPDALLDGARQDAVKDARHKAELYAAAANVKLGPVLSIGEGLSAQPPIPMEMKMMRSDAAGAPPIAQGEQTVGVDVTVVWTIE